MAVADPTSSTLAALTAAGSRLEPSGAKPIAAGVTPYTDAANSATYNLNRASAGWLQVRASATATSIHVGAGRATIAGVELAYAGADISLAALNNQTAYVWASNTAGTLTIGTGASTAGWPATAHVKLAEVPVAAGIIADGDIVDRRIAGMLRGGVVDRQIPLSDLRNTDGSVIDATGDDGKWHVVAAGWNTGTISLQSQAVRFAPEFADLAVELVLPPDYIVGGRLAIIANALYVSAAGTELSGQLDLQVYRIAANGTLSGDACTTDAQTLTDAAADYAFAITPDAIVPGDRLRVLVRANITEGGNTGTIQATLKSLRFQIETR